MPAATLRAPRATRHAPRATKLRPDQLREMARRLEDTLEAWALEVLGLGLCGKVAAAYLPWGEGDDKGCGEPPPPRRACPPCRPGSVQRVAVMAARARAGEGLYHPGDAAAACRAPFGSFSGARYQEQRPAAFRDRGGPADGRGYPCRFTRGQIRLLRRRLEPLRPEVPHADGQTPAQLFACLLEDLIPSREAARPRQLRLFGEDAGRARPGAGAPPRAWVPPAPPPWLFDPERYCRKGARLKALTLPRWALEGCPLRVPAAGRAGAARAFALLLGLRRLPPGARLGREAGENGV
jgi:hypothetical protein